MVLTLGMSFVFVCMNWIGSELIRNKSECSVDKLGLATFSENFVRQSDDLYKLAKDHSKALASVFVVFLNLCRGFLSLFSIIYTVKYFTTKNQL